MTAHRSEPFSTRGPLRAQASSAGTGRREFDRTRRAEPMPLTTRPGREDADV
jgi:hypothetical protein